MKEFKKQIQSFGKALLFPISLLSFMAIFLGLSAALQNKVIMETVPFLKNEIIQLVLTFIRRISVLPFTYLPILFAAAIPLGMVKRDREVAVYSSIAGYIAMLLGMRYILGVQGQTVDTTAVKYLTETLKMTQEQAVLKNSLYIEESGIFVYRMNVVGGIIAGLMGVWIHNKFRNVELHQSLTFYSGKRFVPIASVLIMSVLGGALTFIWPVINMLIMYMGNIISSSGLVGVFLYGVTEKIINPTGLHHILNQVFRFTALGGVENINGETLVGSLNIYLYQLDNGLKFSTEATKYLAQGKILHMVFGMPAAIYAMYKCALPEKRNKVLKFFIPGLTAVILTGITEPIEFTFIFISPILWIINSIFAGLAFLVPAVFNVAIGNIQGGIIDWLVFGVLQGAQTKWYIFLFLGPIFFGLYYFSYKFIIEKFNILTLGRQKNDFEDDDISEDNNVEKLNENDEILAKNIVDGLGGLDNITDIDNCISRLRVEIKDMSKVNKDLLKLSNPSGIVTPDENTVHVVYGGRVTKMRNIVDDYVYKMKK
ncbi:MAG: PTS transporter subunit EIIC [Leptotrichiaceae bacterium]|nr:PTS transporter subunit EIIC [Leptotrichiaceae bacterium]MBP6281085.1 PTS transporter subunit EIIC [Leptotrichiaceae bacterium]MBP7100642.1 PTS transporter subunit EIIC [Leptotrichiaceae bacterium]MBP7725509.1 PTS transporter subunit EIIC [Leptotrichiaceae bacterium]MBP9630135.1 PTS transporter subunit EIIC [Leptotrichiaceae bacterium]